MRPRRPSPPALLGRIREHDFTQCSDGDLRLAIRQLRSRAGDEPPETLLPSCFAVVAEAVDRRLGLWRLFDDSTEATSEAASPVDGTGLIAGTVAEVARRRRHSRGGDILLPAEFYGAARRLYETGYLRFRATDEQLLAAVHLSRGSVVQMDAGEGKTVAIAIAATFHAMLGRLVHIITANDYLAQRDAASLEPVYRSLGLMSGPVLAHTEEAERRHIYRRSIVYGTMRELGFDHLRDNLKTTAAAQVLQPLDVAIVDEADHALIDEAFTPLIISGNPLGGTRMAVRVNAAVASMIELQRAHAAERAQELDSPGVKPGDQLRVLAALTLADPESVSLRQHFSAHPGHRARARALSEDDHAALSESLYYAIHPGNHYVTLTELGREFLERRLGPVFGSPAPEWEKPLNRQSGSGRRTDSVTPSRLRARRHGIANQVSQALRAHLLLRRDVDYVVDDDGIVLVDPHTGRPKPDNIYQQGLQPAVEAREGVTVRPENETLAQVSVSGFIGRYQQVAGITGTADTAAGEFQRRYGLPVAIVPPVNPTMRVTPPPMVYLDREDKLAAVVDEVAARHRTGQPVLVATATVEQSGEMGSLLQERGIPHRVLNAVTTHAEARIVRDAGAFGAVTVATPMAGRGTDMLLEPELEGRIIGQTVEEIHRLLPDGSGAVGVVQVACPSPEQMELLRAGLARSGEYGLSPTVGRLGLRVTMREWDESRTGRAALEFSLGLCVIGTEVHDSGRITLQLDGRSGRQGQFGLARTILSLEDRLVSLDAEAILKLAGCRTVDPAGRPCYTGPEVSRRIRQLQEAADREGEAQRSLMQDYAAELDRQTHLYHERRRQLMDMASSPGTITRMCRDTVERVSASLVRRHFGPSVDDEYSRRFTGLHEEVWKSFAVDCSPLHGTDFALLPEALAGLLLDRLEEQGTRAAPGAFPELARLFRLQVCGELWPSHLAALRDLVAVTLLDGHSHKSAVALSIRRCADEWRGFWERVDEVFLSRLATLPDSSQGEAGPPVALSAETRRLLDQLAADTATASPGSPPSIAGSCPGG